MKVDLIDYTGKHAEDGSKYAAALLIFTKSTRLEMKPGLFDEIMRWPMKSILGELEYMANTIPSSWEFVDYSFLVSGVTRAFTHQFVRSRQFSFAQQTMRVLNVKGWDYLTGPSINADAGLKDEYEDAMERIAATYDHLIECGAAVEDARGILPTNILTNIVAKCNMRTFVELVRKRSSPRTQDEYRLVLDAMQIEVMGVHPWIRLFIKRTFEMASQELDARIKSLDIPPVEKINMMKLIDQMRGQS
jgi:flavin-dependent thymidylate synthase